MATVKFMYLRNKKRQPIGCIASFVEMGNVYYAVSAVHSNDKFDRNLAKNIAEGRLLKATELKGAACDKNWFEIQTAIYEHLIQYPLSSKVVKCAKYWIDSSKLGVIEF